MTITNRALTITPGFGTALQNDTLFLSANQALAAASTTTITTSTLVPTVTRGYIKLKISQAATANPTVTTIVVTGTDGTVFSVLYHYSTAGGLTLNTNGNGVLAGPYGQIEFLVPFISDQNINSISAAVTLTGATATAKLDLELATIS